MTSRDSLFLVQDVLRSLGDEADQSSAVQAQIASDMLEDLRRRPASPSVVREYLRLAPTLQSQYLIQEAETCTRDALAAAKASCDPDSIYSAAIVRCRHCVSTGDFLSAFECLLDAEAATSSRGPDPVLDAHFAVERSLALFDLERYAESALFFDSALGHSQDLPLEARIRRAAAAVFLDGPVAARPMLVEVVALSDSQPTVIGPRVLSRFWLGLVDALVSDSAAVNVALAQIREIGEPSNWNERAACLSDAVEGVHLSSEPQPVMGVAKLLAALARARGFWPRLREPTLAFALAAKHFPGDLLRSHYDQQRERDSQEATRLLGLPSQFASGQPLSSLSVIERTDALLTDNLERRVSGVFNTLWETVITTEFREDETGEHPMRVGRLSRLLAAKLDKPEAFCRDIEKAGAWHDIGKVAVPDAIIRSPARLAPHDREAMQDHAVLGAQLLAEQGAHHAAIQMAVSVARSHHERWMGGGYPDGLVADAIPEPARIVALAESFDAMTHKRAWRPAIPVLDAINIIAAERGKQFDPVFTDAFVQLTRELFDTHGDRLDSFLAEGTHVSPTLKIRSAIRRRATR